MNKMGIGLSGIMLIFVSTLHAATDKFNLGPVFKEYGPHAAVNTQVPIPSSVKVLFDVSEQGDHERPNKRFESLARFMNMLVASGVEQSNIKLALVVHGKASTELLSDTEHQKAFSSINPNAELLKQLMQNGIDVYVCGQSIAYLDIPQSHLIDGVKVGLSAMSVNALLQQQGYTYNPF